MAVAMVALAATTAPAAGGTADDVRELQERQRQVRAERVAAASQVDAARADVDELQAALRALDEAIDDQTAALAAAEQRAADAATAAEEARAMQARAEAALTEAQTTLGSQALDAYVRPPEGSLLDAFQAGAITDVAVRAGLSRLQAAQLGDALDAIDAATDDARTARERAETAAERARQRQAEAADALAGLQTAEQRQQQMAFQAEDRLERATAEADILASLDATVAAQLKQRQAVLAEELRRAREAAERRAASEAAQRRAAAARASSSSSGSSSSSAPSSSSSAGASSGASPGTSRSVVISGSGEIVSVGGIRVHQSIAGQVAGLLSAAASAGFNLGGGGYRDSGDQVALRRANCGSSEYAVYQMPASGCRPPTARPGSSMHERGLAIDFVCNGALITSRGSSCFRWLAANAGSYGLRNLPSEPWHWSTNGN